MAKKQKHPKKKRDTPLRKILRGVLMTLLALFLVMAVSGTVVGGYFFVNVMGTVRGDQIINLEEMKEQQGRTTIIYAFNRDGEAIEYARLHGVENRIWLDLDQMGEPNPYSPTGMPIIADAFVALEDMRFWEHNGVDWFRFASIFVNHNLTQGASTITQQLIKNLTGENQVTSIRKFREIMTALNLERNYDKETIIEAYLNTLYLGNGAYGVMTGAETYFGRPLDELNIAEVASLAAITQAPWTLNPIRNPENNRRRQLTALQNMFEQDLISEEQFEEAVDFEMVFTNSPDFVPREVPDAPQAQPERINNFYVDFVIETVINDLMRVHGLTKAEATRRVYSGGLTIMAAVDIEIQQHMENVFRERTTWSNLRGREDNPIHAAMAIMDYEGRVVGIVGGAGEKTQNRSLNRAAQSWRQPGSTIKPLTSYGPAIESNDLTWSSMIRNSAFPFHGEMWPRNFGANFGDGRNVTAQVALQRSYNTTAARLVNETVGLRESFEFLSENFGFERLDPVNDMVLPSMALGSMRHGMSALEMTAAYATMGNGGTFYSPFAYHEVFDNRGELLLSREDDQVTQRAFSADTAQVLNEILQTVSIRGFAHNNNLNHIGRFRTFGKTGTTNDNRDRWFAGGTPYFVSAVWFGYDVPRDLGRMTNPSGRIWVEVFNRIHASDDFSTSTEFPTTSSAVRRTYCTSSGLIAGDNCSSTRSGWYRTNNIPRTCNNCRTAAPEPPPATEPVTTPPAPTLPPLGNWVDQILGGGNNNDE